MDTDLEQKYKRTREEFDKAIFELMSALDKTKCDENKVQRLLGAAHYLHQKLNNLFYEWKYKFEVENEL